MILGSLYGIWHFISPLSVLRLEFIENLWLFTYDKIMSRQKRTR